jgi:hypothetical protein
MVRRSPVLAIFCKASKISFTFLFFNTFQHLHQSEVWRVLARDLNEEIIKDLGLRDCVLESFV